MMLLAFLFLGVLFPGRASCTLIGTGSGQRVMESTSFKFYGEQHVSLNLTGAPVLVLGVDDAADLCSGYYDKTLTAKGYTGHVVVITQNRQFACASKDALYSKLSAVNAIAVLITTPQRIPGQFLLSHDGSRGFLTRNHPMPFLQASNNGKPTNINHIIPLCH